MCFLSFLSSASPDRGLWSTPEHNVTLNKSEPAFLGCQLACWPDFNLDEWLVVLHARIRYKSTSSVWEERGFGQSYEEMCEPNAPLICTDNFKIRDCSCMHTWMFCLMCSEVLTRSVLIFKLWQTCYRLTFPTLVTAHKRVLHSQQAGRPQSVKPGFGLSIPLKFTVC